MSPTLVQECNSRPVDLALSLPTMQLSDIKIRIKAKTKLRFMSAAELDLKGNITV